MKDISKAILIIGLAGIGIAGIYNNIEHSGWLIACTVILCLDY